MAMMMNPMAASMMMNSMAPNGDQESSDSESDAPPPKAPPVPAPQVAAPPLQAPAPPPQPGQGNMGPVEDNELDQIVTRSASLLKNIPRRWLSEICERLDASFDATLTANLSVTGLLACIYLFTRMRPCVQMSVLRALLAIK